MNELSYVNDLALSIRSAANMEGIGLKGQAVADRQHAYRIAGYLRERARQHVLKECKRQGIAANRQSIETMTDGMWGAWLALTGWPDDWELPT